ncbi:MAG TPA: histidine kinase N-terminal 7TM domain-containing protein, partial [Oscillospiraceae bacterium]|nr:histidine kinase N-terminal 7TM domain-containing protein [Oscillospiraceae bacterium]
MDLVFANDTYYLILLHAVSIFLLVTVNFAVWLKAKKIPLLYSYLSVQTVLLLWMSAKILKTVAPDVRTKFFFVVVQYVGVCFLSVLFFAFAYRYAKGRPPKKRTLGLLSVIPALSFLTLATNPYHGLFYAHFDFWGDSFGPVFYVHQAYSYTLLGAGIALCARYFFRQFGEKRTQAVLFSAAILIPLAANVIYVFGWVEDLFGFSPPCDITPISCNVSLAMFAIAVFRFRFFDDVKIARRAALDALPDGILILDQDGRTADYNETFGRMYLEGRLHASGGDGFSGEGGTGAPKRGETTLPLALEPRDTVFRSIGGGYVRLACRAIAARGKVRGFAFRFSDVTLRQTLLEETARKNRELTRLNGDLQRQAGRLRALSAARTRNFIAREVHDILGHSVVLVISLLEAARLSFHKEEADVGGLVRRAKLTLQDCGRKSSPGEQTAVSGESLLLEELASMVYEVRLASVDAALTVT